MDASPEQITALADQLSQLAKVVAASTDPKDKKYQTQALVLQAKTMISQIQDPFDAIMDHVVNAYTIAATLALMEIGVFEAIPMQGPATITELAGKCKADESLITRLMRQLLCVGIFASPSPGTFTHNRLSIGLSAHLSMTGKYFFEVAMDEMVPSIISFNRFIQAHGRHDITSYTTTPHSWHDGKVGSNFWEVLSSDPSGARLQRFSKGLSLFAAMHPVMGIYPFANVLAPGNSAARPLCVDIGGGRGLAMLELRSACPDLKGEIVLQDRAAVLDDIPASELPDITKMVHDFFTEQPVKDAQVYYIRRVMHDWQDADAALILKSIVPAMGKDSRVLVSDMCMPDPVELRDAGAVWMDLMMLTIGGKERTGRDWKVLAELSGLELKKVWMQPEKFGPLCVVEFMLPEAGTVEKTTNGISAHFNGTKSEVALAENVSTSTDVKPHTKAAEEPEELTGVAAEAKAYGEQEPAAEPVEVLSGDMHKVGLQEGMPVVSSHATETMV